MAAEDYPLAGTDQPLHRPVLSLGSRTNTWSPGNCEARLVLLGPKEVTECHPHATKPVGRDGVRICLKFKHAIAQVSAGDR